MKKAIINVKVEPEVKDQAMQVAAALGFTLSGFINASLKQLIRDRRLRFNAEEDHP